jgi:hypothetical protein
MAPTTRRRGALRWLAALLWLLLALVVAAAIGTFLFLRASLPTLDGRLAADGLRAPVTVHRDGNGVPTIRGSDRTDIAWATGYVHAQERFFQMDLLRRSATGELAALIGPRLVPIDRERRLHRFAARAGGALAALPEADRAIVERYAAGVNAGLRGLSARPFEYAVLRATPRPWRAEDTLLVAWAMYFDLQDEQLQRVLARGWLRDQGTTPAQLAFLLPTASPYDAPLDAAAIADAAAPLPAEAPAWFGRPAKAKTAAGPIGALDAIGSASAKAIGNGIGTALGSASGHPIRDGIGAADIGSNNWVLAGTRTKSGAAMVANDMHLNLRLPHVWFRAAFEIEAGAGQPARRIVGVTLPGAPLVVAGSNGQVAWGLTNSYGAFVDLLELEFDPGDALRYRLGAAGAGEGGWGLLRTVEERIAVAGAPDEVLRVQETAYGPVWVRGGRRYARALGRARPWRRQLRPDRARARGQRCRGAGGRPALGRAGAEHGRRRLWRAHRLDHRRRPARSRCHLGLDLPGASGIGGGAHLARAGGARNAAEPGRPAGRPDRDRQLAPARRRRLCRDRRWRSRPRRTAAAAARRGHRLARGQRRESRLQRVPRRPSPLSRAVARPGPAGARRRRRRSGRCGDAGEAGRVQAAAREHLERPRQHRIGRLPADAQLRRRPLRRPVRRRRRGAARGRQAGQLRARDAALAGGDRAPARREAGRLAAPRQRRLAGAAARLPSTRRLPRSSRRARR